MQSHNLQLAFKGERDYIHGTDLFNEIPNYFNDKELTQINFTINKKIQNGDGTIYTSKDPHQLKSLSSAAKASANLLVNGEKFWVIFLFKEEAPTTCPRISYDEDLLTKKCVIEKECITLHETSPYTFIETIVSMHKKLLLTLYPNARKWLFTKLTLSRFVSNANTVTIALSHNFNLKLVKSKIIVNGHEVGELYFSLVVE